MNSKKFVPYFFYLLSLMSLIAVFTMPGGIRLSIFYVLFSALWYQTGTSFLKRKLWAWWSALILLSLFSAGNFVSVYITFILPLVDASVTGVGGGRWITLGRLLFTLYLIFTLFHGATKSEFRNQT